MISILIADDFDLLREDLKELINAQPDMRVVGEAASGAAIVELARSVKSDIILRWRICRRASRPPRPSAMLTRAG